MGLYNMDKLPSYTEKFENAKIADIGAGAVGSHVVEKLLDMKISDIEIIDFDKLEDENLSKSSKLYRQEDIGSNKANALARRANELIGKNTVHGINANITMFGPMAFAGYDAIIAPLDNYGAKIYLNQLWKQIPNDKKPLLIFGGTIDENAQSNSLDGTGPCLRCLLSEEWLENPLVRTSCTGPQYRGEEQSLGIVATTGNASDLSACFMIEHLRGRLLGIEGATNNRLMYKPFPGIELKKNLPMARNCPDCARYHPPKNLVVIEDCDVMTLTVKELFARLDVLMDTTDYMVRIPNIEYAKVMYGGLIVNDYCKSCGSEITDLYRHEFRTKYEDLLCDNCRKAGRKAKDTNGSMLVGNTIRVIKKKNCNETLMNKTLFELGWTIGGFIKVVVRNEESIDILDPDFEKEYTFYCQNDSKRMKELTELEG